MKVFTLLSLFVFCSIYPAQWHGYAQEGPKGSTRGKDKSKTTSGTTDELKRSTREKERVRVINRTEYKTIKVKSDVGYLSVVAIRSASVKLIPIDQKRPPLQYIVKEQDDTLNLANLIPGNYRIVVEHADYHPYSEEMKIEPADLGTLYAAAKMISKYGEVRIGGVPPGAKVFLDKKAINTSNLSPENSTISLTKVLVGKYPLKVSKEGFLDYEKEIDVQPGSVTFEPVQLAVAVASLTLSSQPGARVYADGEYRGAILSDGKLTIHLFPGPRKIMVSKDGFQEWNKALTLGSSPTTLDVNLIPVPISAEGSWEPANKESKWFPKNSGWQFNKSGALIRGDKLTLFDTELNSDYNYYQNVRLEFDVVFNNGKGVSWVVRAKDPDNYYLFELTGPTAGTTVLNFYICQDGKLYLKDSQRVVEKMDVKDDTFHIIFSAQGNRFETKMNITSAPQEKPRWIGVFQDNTFSLGGIGFRGKDQSEALLQAFFVNPQ
ncbi:MAG: PEGA domain-containing protein [Acidobacteria bacterium]|nr:PEGA domain-containing protein [Acidobacteriota bacterium]